MDLSSAAMDGDTSQTGAEPRYPLAYHLENARSYGDGVDRHIVAGAVSGERATTFTEKRMQKLVDDHLKREVPVDQAQED